MKGMRTTSSGSRAASRSRMALGIPAVLALVPVLVLVPLLIGGCGTADGGETSTTSTTGVPEPTTTVVTVAPASSDSTLPPETGTTSTTGIVITIPTTATTEATTTTTEALSSAETRLPNGHTKAMGYIDQVYIQDGTRYISIDYAEMLTGAAAHDAAVAAGEIEPGDDLPNDYFISNTNPMKRTFEVSNAVAITTSTRWVAGDDMNAPCTWSDFISFWGPAGALADSEKHLHSMPWWIERDGQVVVKIDEQYLP